jgi:hypothetical protein
MIVIARGSLPQPDAPDIDDEMRVADRLKAGGLMTTAYSRGATSATTGLFGDRTIERCDNGRTWDRPSSASPPHVHR